MESIYKEVNDRQYYKVDTPGFGDFVDNSNCWEPVRELRMTSQFHFFVSNMKIHNKTFW